MDGVAAVRQVLVNYSALTSIVASSKISANALPSGTSLPAVELSSISRFERKPVNKPGMINVKERVQVTAMAARYPDIKLILRLITKALIYNMPIVSGIEDVVITAEGGGPDLFNDESSIHLQSRDFMVSFNEATS